jgi:hypothetical protein
VIRATKGQEHATACLAPMLTFLACLLGLANGVRHAMEPDHLAAVSTAMVEQKSARASVRFAASWGLGHAAMLLLVGGALMLLRTRMPPRVEEGFEIGVALMLIALGARAINQASRTAHAHPPADRLAVRPLAIGIVHGLAGSGALTALVVSKAPSLVAGLLFLGLYGTGATVGMMALAGAAGRPLARLARKDQSAKRLLVAVGALSLLMGVGWGVAAAMKLSA